MVGRAEGKMSRVYVPLMHTFVRIVVRRKSGRSQRSSPSGGMHPLRLPFPTCSVFFNKIAPTEELYRDTLQEAQGRFQHLGVVAA